MYDDYTGQDIFAATAPVLFPAPPPTTNALTAAQRARLVRSSNKLGRILGATPHFVDRGSFDAASESSSRASFDSDSSASSHSRSSSLRSRNSLQSTDITVPTTRKIRNSAPPMLRLALPPMLSTIPASPLSPHHHMLTSQDGQVPRNHDSASPEVSPTAPTFTIPTATATRRRKMDKLRRTLGDDVPLALVFPSYPSPSPSPRASDEYDSDCDSSRSVSPSLSSSRTPSASGSEESLATPTTSPLAPTTPLDAEQHDSCPLPLPPTPTPSGPAVRVRTTPPAPGHGQGSPKRTIAHARDSLYVLRLQKAFVPPPASKVSESRKAPVTPLTASRPAPPPPPGSPPRTPPATKAKGPKPRRPKRKAAGAPPPPVPFYSYANTSTNPTFRVKSNPTTSTSHRHLAADITSTPNKPTSQRHRRRASNPPMSPSSEYASSGSSTSSSRRHSPTPSLSSALDVILECPESGWFDDGHSSDGDEADTFDEGADFELVDEDEVVEAAMWSWGAWCGGPGSYGHGSYVDAYAYGLGVALGA